MEYAWRHRSRDAAKLLLGHAPQGVDLRAAAQQIEGWQTARHKWPSLYDDPRFLFPPRLNREQASSEATAAYKGTLAATVGGRMADLTGGMGIDTLSLAAAARSMDYYERDAMLCELMRHNASLRGASAIAVHCGDSLQALAAMPDGTYDLAFIDPARRDNAGRRVAAFEDCTPDIIAAMPLLQRTCRRLMVKASPMVDITLALRQLPSVQSVHIVALRGECKELLFCIDFSLTVADTKIYCVNLMQPEADRVGERTMFSYTLDEARAAAGRRQTFASLPKAGGYLYEPDATLMKAGCHALLAERCGVEMLSANSHFAYSDTLVEAFPGRTYRIVAEAPLERRSLEPLLPNRKVNIVSRNHPLGAEQIKKKLRLSDGGSGDRFLIVTRVDGRGRCWVGERVGS